MPKKNLTIADIAHMAGVSKTTVSRYLNEKYEFMSEDTRLRIKAVIENANYQPNNIARSLKSHKSMLIGLVVADIESPFSSAVIKSVGDAMNNTGYNIIIANSDKSPKKEQSIIQSLLGQKIDGLIINTTQRQNPFLINIANGGLPVVLLDRDVTDYKFDYAFIENKSPIREAVLHLHQEGFGNIAYITQTPHEQISPRLYRRRAHIETLTELGVQNAADFVYDIEDNQNSVCAAVKQLMKQSANDTAPPAIITSNGVTLMRVAQAIRSLGLHMPNQIGLCGYDEWGWASELGWAQLMNVGISTLTPSIDQLGKLTVKALLNRIQNPGSKKVHVSVPAPLHVRTSTKLSDFK
ncbi:MAG: LacI family DNA-binding transcriptional regulator [Oscillospiraceae bacterium]